MDQPFYEQIVQQSLEGGALTKVTAEDILGSKKVELISLIHSAFEVRKKYFGKQVTIHIINNAQNGFCPENCHYCAQAKSSKADIDEYPLKSDDEILLEAKDAHERGAHRYCMVFAGRGPSQKRIEHLTRLIKSIKSQYKIEVCVSAGLLDKNKAKVLADAGLDRLNHNLNTSARHYSKICTTHTYNDRFNTLQAARESGLQICSGVILGMGEGADDVIEMAYTLRELKADSIPVNFFIPISGTQLNIQPSLSPEYCLRVLCLFRLINPQAEIRIAAGRERYLKSMEAMALYPANSLFLGGYLNAKGEERKRTFQMIKDAGFTIVSEYSLDELIDKETSELKNDSVLDNEQVILKRKEDLRPKIVLR